MMKYEKDPSFIKGMVISYLFLLISLPITPIPFIGPILAFTLVPYLAGALGARFAHPKERVPLALTASITWAVVETAVLLAVLNVITSQTPMGLVIEGFEILIILTIFLSNIIFMLLGVFYPWKDPFSEINEN